MAEHGSSSLGTSRSESQSSGCWVHDSLKQVSRTHWSGIIGNQNQHCKCLKLGTNLDCQEVVHSSHWNWHVFFEAATVIWVWQLHHVDHKIAHIHSTISDYVPYKLWTLQVSLHTSFRGQNLLQPSVPVVPVAPVTKFTIQTSAFQLEWTQVGTWTARRGHFQTPHSFQELELRLQDLS